MFDRLIACLRERWGADRTPMWERVLVKALDRIWARGVAVQTIFVSPRTMKIMFPREVIRTRSGSTYILKINVYQSAYGAIIVELDRHLGGAQFRLLHEGEQADVVT